MSKEKLLIDSDLISEESDDWTPPHIPTIPRINQSMIHKHIGHIISIVGSKIRTFNYETCFEASDERYFQVYYNQRELMPNYESQFIEIRGIPDERNRICYISHQEYGNDFNMEIWNKFINLTKKYPQLF